MWFDEHFEGAQLFRETLTFHLRQDRSGTTVRYGLAGADGPGRVSQRAELSEPDERGAVDLEIPLGFDVNTPDDEKPRPGFRGRLLLKASPWNVTER